MRLVLILLQVILSVSSQDFVVTQNHSFPFTCDGTTVQYTCKAPPTESIVQWVLVPINPVNAPVPTIPALSNIASNINGPMNVTDGIVVELVAVTPSIITTLTITSTGVYNLVNVVCRSALNPSLNAMRALDSNEDSGDPPGNLVLFRIPADGDEGIFNVEFERSTANAVERYECRCFPQNCENMTVSSEQLSCVLRAPVGANYAVQVCAVNFCGVTFCSVIENINLSPITDASMAFPSTTVTQSSTTRSSTTRSSTTESSTTKNLTSEDLSGSPTSAGDIPLWALIICIVVIVLSVVLNGGLIVGVVGLWYKLKSKPQDISPLEKVEMNAKY